MAKTRTNKRRKLWLRLFLAAIALVFVATPLASWLEYRHLPHIPGRVAAFVGVYPDFKDGQKASLLRLSQEIARHPQADSFVMRRTGTLFVWDDVDWNETIYDRHRQTIIDGNICLGDTEGWGGVNDTVVKKVATTSGKFQGFGQSGCQNILPYLCVLWAQTSPAMALKMKFGK